jgi:hypothetical protein
VFGDKERLSGGIRVVNEQATMILDKSRKCRPVQVISKGTLVLIKFNEYDYVVIDGR